MRTVFHVSTPDADPQASALGNVSSLLADDTAELDGVAVVSSAMGELTRLQDGGTPTSDPDLVGEGGSFADTHKQLSPEREV